MADDDIELEPTPKSSLKSGRMGATEKPLPSIDRLLEKHWERFTEHECLQHTGPICANSLRYRVPTDQTPEDLNTTKGKERFRSLVRAHATRRITDPKQVVLRYEENDGKTLAFIHRRCETATATPENDVATTTE